MTCADVFPAALSMRFVLSKESRCGHCHAGMGQRLLAGWSPPAQPCPALGREVGHRHLAARLGIRGVSTPAACPQRLPSLPGIPAPWMAGWSQFLDSSQLLRPPCSSQDLRRCHQAHSMRIRGPCLTGEHGLTPAPGGSTPRGAALLLAEPGLFNTSPRVVMGRAWWGVGGGIPGTRRHQVGGAEAAGPADP